MSREICVIDVPTKAGTHWAGQYGAPEALRKAGLHDTLESRGFEVRKLTLDLGNDAYWRPSPIINGVRNEKASLNVLDRIAAALQDDHDAQNSSQSEALPFYIFIGGDCSILSPILSVTTSSLLPQKLGLLYVDNDADLTLPCETTAPGSSGILDSMTLTHLTQRDGGLDSMRRFASPDGTALIDRHNIALFGLGVLQPKSQHYAYLLDNQFRCFTNEVVQRGPVGAAEEALEWLGSKVDMIFVHFDVNVIDSGEFPLGNYPSYGGLSCEAVLSAMKVFLASRKVYGMTVTEVNPNNDPDGSMVGKIVQGIVEGLSTRT